MSKITVGMFSKTKWNQEGNWKTSDTTQLDQYFYDSESNFSTTKENIWLTMTFLYS